MKKVLLLLSVLLVGGFFNSANAYHFSHVTSSGHMLYYNIIDNINLQVEVVNQLGVTDQCGYSTPPTGNLEINSTVQNEGITYTVTSIGPSAFEGCTGLTSVIIPSTILTIKYSAFYGCTGLTGTLNIPNGVITIYTWAFGQCTSLTSVIISNSVRGIGTSAFSGCTGVTSVTLGTALQSIGDWNFAYCTNLQTINFYSDSCISFCDTTADSIAPAFFRSGIRTINIGSNVKVIPMFAFYDCDSLDGIVMPNSIKRIGRMSFAYCDGLQSVVINSGESIGFGCFAVCDGLKRVEIGSVKNMDEWCFAYCGELRHVEIGDSLLTIKIGCFSDDSTLGFISLGSSVALIEQYAFDACALIDTIICHAMIAPQIASNVFSDVSSNAHIMIPCGSTMYQARWSHFNTFIEMNPLVFTAIPDNPANGSVSIMTMPTCTSSSAVVYAQASNGYHFDHWSDGSTDNPYFLTVTEDMALIAYFVSDAFILTASSANESMGTVQIITVPTPTNPQGSVLATPNPGFVFDHWSDGYTNPLYTLTLTQDTNLVAYFKVETVSAFSLTAVSSDPNKGSVYVVTEPTAENPYAKLVAVPNSGYQFDHWSDGVTSNPYELTLTSDTILIAYFTSSNGIGNVDGGFYTVSVHEKQVYIETTLFTPIEVYDIRGRRIYKSNGNVAKASLEVPAVGVYLVSIGQSLTKVVVL